MNRKAFRAANCPTRMSFAMGALASLVLAVKAGSVLTMSVLAVSAALLGLPSTPLSGFLKEVCMARSNWLPVGLLLLVNMACHKPRPSGPTTSPTPTPNVSIEKTAKNQRAADRILRLSNEAISRFASPREHAEAIARLTGEIERTDFRLLSSVTGFLSDLHRVNGYITARTELTSRKEEEISDSRRLGGNATLGYSVLQIRAGGGLTTEHDLRNRKMSIYDVRPRPEFNPVEFGELLRHCGDAHSVMVGDFVRRGFGYQLQRGELCSRTWDWRWSSGIGKATITFRFKSDGTFDAKLVPDSRWDWPGLGFVDTGFGEWSLEDNRLTVTMTHVSVAGVRKANQVVFMARRTVDEFGSEEILLIGDADNRLSAAP